MTTKALLLLTLLLIGATATFAKKECHDNFFFMQQTADFSATPTYYYIDGVDDLTNSRAHLSDLPPTTGFKFNLIANPPTDSGDFFITTTYGARVGFLYNQCAEPISLSTNSAAFTTTFSVLPATSIYKQQFRAHIHFPVGFSYTLSANSKWMCGTACPGCNTVTTYITNTSVDTSYASPRFYPAISNQISGFDFRFIDNSGTIFPNYLDAAAPACSDAADTSLSFLVLVAVSLCAVSIVNYFL